MYFSAGSWHRIYHRNSGLGEDGEDREDGEDEEDREDGEDEED